MRAGGDFLWQWLVEVEEAGEILLTHPRLGHHLLHRLLQAAQCLLETLASALAGWNVEAERLTMSLGGGVQLEWYTSTRGLELVIHANGEFEYLLINRPEEVVAEGELPSVDDQRAQEYMRWFIRAN